jgi:hypothetical protein
MKNIHVIPTDKPSRLAYDFNKLILNSKLLSPTLYKNQNIYITSDEEIKEEDWCLCSEELVHKVVEIKSNIGIIRFQDGVTEVLNACKKIILATDQDLIKDGVQAIDDEFLEWFIKNPSCERVSIEEEDYSQKCRECGETVKRGYNCAKGCFMKSGNFIPTDKNINYKIIIPQKEPKPETIKQEPCKFCGKTLREQMKGCGEITCYRQFLSKQETIEQTDKTNWKAVYEDSLNMQRASNAGYESKIAELQAQIKQSYSEEEVLKSFDNIGFKQITLEELNTQEYQPFITDEDGNIWVIDKEKWFEQFKKK